MSEQLSTRRCDTPLLQAFVDNRTILVKIKELGVSPTLVNFMIRDALVHCRKVTAERQGDNVTHLSARR
ncbi:TPA: hypothetical protein ACGJU2_005460 [Pseudomonas aeruginosa]|uniref:hypothetical protein n=1 Tax=Pseudomonas aeruginosa TaxID=287 RepID=UPI00053D595B|nr:hypothetical protein [Pseudomonas aeruginosa]